MSNSYRSIPTDPNAGVGSSGVKGACSKNKIYIALGVLVTMVARTAVAEVEVSPDAVNWPGKLVKFDKATPNTSPSGMNLIETTTTGAAKKGWLKSDEPCDPLLGEAWMYGGVRSKRYNGVVYFTPEVGDKPGVASGIEVDYYGYVEKKLIGKFFGEEKTSKDGTYRSISVALRDGKKANLCDKKKTVASGNAPYVRVAPGMANMNVPIAEDSPELLSNFKQGSCLSYMGYHWATDIEGGKDLTFKTENVVPIVPMYSSKDKTLNGIFFMATSQKQMLPFSKDGPLNMWDASPGLLEANGPGPFYMCGNFCGYCQFTGTENGWFTTMHWMFKDTSAEICQKKDQPHCRGGVYPTKYVDTPGRCGPLFGGRKCNCSGWEEYCNTENGWCGNTGAHKNAQKGTEYDCEDGQYPTMMT